MTWFVYILFCDQKTYYIGLTHTLSERIKSHKSRQNIATKEFSEITLVYTEKFQARTEAEKRERQLKGRSVTKKNALIQGNVDLLKNLSKSHEPVDSAQG